MAGVVVVVVVAAVVVVVGVVELIHFLMAQHSKCV
jgi:hypothetical protein